MTQTRARGINTPREGGRQLLEPTRIAGWIRGVPVGTLATPGTIIPSPFKGQSTEEPERSNGLGTERRKQDDKSSHIPNPASEQTNDSLEDSSIEEGRRRVD